MAGLLLHALSAFFGSEFQTCKLHTRKYIHCGHIKIEGNAKCSSHAKRGGLCKREHMQLERLKSRRKSCRWCRDGRQGKRPVDEYLN